MASLKSLLNATIKAGSTFAYPAGNRISIGTIVAGGGWDHSLLYTAPADGIILIRDFDGSGVCISDAPTGAALYTEGLPSGAHIRCAWVPINKGGKCFLFVFGTTKVANCYFYPAKGQQ